MQYLKGQVLYGSKAVKVHAATGTVDHGAHDKNEQRYSF